MHGRCYCNCSEGLSCVCCGVRGARWLSWKMLWKPSVPSTHPHPQTSVPCICAWVYVPCVCVCEYVCVTVSVCMRVSVCVCLYTQTCLCMCVSICLYICICVYVCLCMSVHTPRVAGVVGVCLQNGWEWPRRWLRQTKQPQRSELQAFL